MLIAGPNGGGKSTFYDSHLADSPLPFLNADVVAAGTGIDSFEAARFLDAQRDALIGEHRGFITETVLSDPAGAKLGMLESAMAAGYDVIVIYIGAPPELLGLRVDQRVARGGHDVPRDELQSRFVRSLQNLRKAIDLGITVRIYDNGSASEPHRLLAVFAKRRVEWQCAGPIPDWARSILRRGGRRPAKRRRRAR